MEICFITQVAQLKLIVCNEYSLQLMKCTTLFVKYALRLTQVCWRAFRILLLFFEIVVILKVLYRVEVLMKIQRLLNLQLSLFARNRRHLPLCSNGNSAFDLRVLVASWIFWKKWVLYDQPMDRNHDKYSSNFSLCKIFLKMISLKESLCFSEEYDSEF